MTRAEAFHGEVSPRPAAAAASGLALALALALAWAGNLHAQSVATASAEPGFEIDPIVVSATRVPEASAALPVSVDRLGQSEIQDGQLQVNLSESLPSVPGVNAQNRQNYAQDLQISVRGFGARSSFGVRGVRLYADGIPGTMPDGQGQFSNFDLGSADHIEVLRGPFSALYGNSSGGVIAIFTQDAPPQPSVGAEAEYGSYGLQRYALKGMGRPADVNLVVDVSHFSTDGYRDHSAAQRNVLNAKARWQPDEQSSLTLIVNAIDAPDAQDPLGLTRAQLTADPQQAGVGALIYDTRKSVEQGQLGLDYERDLGTHDALSALVYGGQRATLQFQAIPRSTEAPLADPGGVIDLHNAYGGIDAHVTDHRDPGGMPLQVTAGLSYDDLQDARRDYTNFMAQLLGVEGALRIEQANHVYDLDQYLQLQWDPSLRWRVEAGIRHNLIEVRSENQLATALGARDSAVNYGAVDPVAGLTFRAGSALDLYGAYGKGFETPTLNDLQYRSTNGSLPGLNIGLRPAHSDDYEIGAKATTAHMRATLAGFFIQTRDELAVQANAEGRSVYENIPLTRRKGAELEVENSWAWGLRTQLSYTHIQALTALPYRSCVGTPCLPVSVPAGNRIPALPADALYAGLSWRHQPSGFTATLEALGRAQIYADDLNRSAAAGYWIADLHGGLEQQAHSWRFSEVLRLDNLTNRRYVGSVIVNESNSRYFEPEPGRSVWLLLKATYL
jgi:iron complex outermembrane receptor protein